MSRLRVLILIGALCVLAGVGGIAFFLGNRFALANLTMTIDAINAPTCPRDIAER